MLKGNRDTYGVIDITLGIYVGVVCSISEREIGIRVVWCWEEITIVLHSHQTRPLSLFLCLCTLAATHLSFLSKSPLYPSSTLPRRAQREHYIIKRSNCKCKRGIAMVDCI